MTIIQSAAAHVYSHQQDFDFQTELLPEPHYYLNGSWGYFTIVAIDPSKPRWEQKERISFSYPLNELPEQLKDWSARGKAEGKNIYISQCIFNAPCRRRAAFHAVGQLFVDLDIYNSPVLRYSSRSQVIQVVYKVCEKHGIPVPSLIMTSGRGYYLKWFIHNLPNKALSIWEWTQKYLVEIFEQMGGDTNAKDASRILRLENTYNYKNNALAEVVEVNYQNGQPARYDFDVFKHLLPYSQAQAREFNEKQAIITAEFAKNRRAITREINQRKMVLDCLLELTAGDQFVSLTAQCLYDYVVTTRGRNKVSIARCDELLKRFEKSLNSGEVIDAKSFFKKKNLAWYRYLDILRLAEHRYPNGTVEDGLRNAFILYACNFYSLSEFKKIDVDFKKEFLTIGHKLASHWSATHIETSTSDVYKRLLETQNGQTRQINGQGREYIPLLTPKNSTLLDLLKITKEEQQLATDDGEFLLRTIIDADEKERRKPLHQETRRRKNGVKERSAYDLERLTAAAEKAKTIKMLKEQGVSVNEIMTRMNMSRSGVYKLLK